MQNTTPTHTVKIRNDLSVVVPDSLRLMTPYILIEQGDWFEDEIKFLRTIIKAGMNIIDIGANYGLYSLSLAVKIGDTGKIWAFEPTAFVAKCLLQSIAENKFGNIELIQAALSDHVGRGSLLLNPNPELNSLQNSDTGNSNSETVDLLTLDAYSEKNQWNHIDFIKLDAEGEEIKIVNGGKKLLTHHSPLIMYELKHGEKLNLPLIEKLEEHGYYSYCLIPGPNVLVPFDKEKLFDSFLLNLFACKKDTATKLDAEGFLIKSIPGDISSETAYSNASIWKEYISALPFSHSLCNGWNKWQEDNSAGERDNYQCALNCYVLSKSEHLLSSDRFLLLSKAYRELAHLVEINPTYSRLLTLTRIAHEIGQRKHAVILLSNLINQLSSIVHASFQEPFIPVLQQYEAINPGKRFKEWLISSILEAYEITHAFSSYFTGQNSLAVLMKLKTLGFQSEEIDRRIELIKKRFNIT